MIKNFTLILLLCIALVNCKDEKHQALENPETVKVEDTFVKDSYTKQEVMIEMRDGIKLHTTIYSPKDTTKTYPMLMMRTPYSCRPYGDDE